MPKMDWEVVTTVWDWIRKLKSGTQVTLTFGRKKFVLRRTK